MRRRRSLPEAETPTLDVTDWTDKTELYMEYPPLVAGKTALFAVHLTQLDDFKPLNAGRPSVEFTPEAGGAADRAARDRSRRGLARFGSKARRPPAGRYRWALRASTRRALATATTSASITVFADEQAAHRRRGEAAGGRSGRDRLLKEQQWTNEFATAPVREAELRTSIRVPATIEPLPGGEAVVVRAGRRTISRRDAARRGRRVRAGPGARPAGAAADRPATIARRSPRKWRRRRSRSRPRARR